MDSCYFSANEYMKQTFGRKVYKLAFDGGFTCPTRDGTLGTRGCCFCSGGSGDFAVPVGEDFDEAFHDAVAVVGNKAKNAGFIAYFQAFSGTYAPLARLERLYSAVIAHPQILALDIATRPDCLEDPVLDLLERLNRIKPVWIELGLQTIHSSTAEAIRRGYPLPVFDEAVHRLKERGIYVIVHSIIGLPGETKEMMWETTSYIGKSGADGIKLQLLHILRGTDLAADYAAGAFEALTLEAYIEVLEGCIRRLPPEMAVHRLTGDGAKRDLIAPLWSADKKAVLHAIRTAFERDGVRQGELFRP